MKAVNNKNDQRKIDATDSVQTLGMSYDAFHGLWIGTTARSSPTRQATI